MKRIFSVFLVGIFLGGCASSRYLESSTHTQVEIKQGNFRMIKPNVQAASSGFSLFGILPLTAPSSTTAWSRLNKNAGIDEHTKKSTQFVNINEERTNTWLILFSIPTYRIRADLVEFIDSERK